MLIKQYPQYVFARKIVSAFRLHVPRGMQRGTLVDVPCGNGEISYTLSRLTNAVVEGYDISGSCIATASKRYHAKNLKFSIGDIHKVIAGKRELMGICLINSFFLLDGREELLEKCYKALNKNGLLVLIVPNISSRNYMNFTFENGRINKAEMSPMEISRMLETKKFKVIENQGICYVNYYGRKELKYFSIFAPFYLRMLNVIFSTFKSLEPGYYTIVCKKRSEIAKG
jgi:2-polyprenyl-3-methyl-5-hydroxy-6-metoxy-1,4-benzoquinol methylase